MNIDFYGQNPGSYHIILRRQIALISADLLTDLAPG